MIIRAGAVGRAAALAVALGAVPACGSPNPDDAPWAKRTKPASYHADSTRVVTLARHALGDTIALEVEALTHGAQGWQVRLLPVGGGTVGGGTVWVDSNDSSVTVVKRY